MNAKSASKPITEGDRVTFFANRGLVDATGTVRATWTEHGTQVARVEVDPAPFVLSGSHIVDIADLKRIRGAR